MDILEKAKQSICSKGNKSLKAKKIEFSLSQISLADLMVKRMAKLSNKVTCLEEKVLQMANSGDLSNSENIILHRILSKTLENNTDYIQKVTGDVDWEDLETQLIAMSEDKGQKVNLDVSRGAEHFLTRLSQLKLENPKQARSPEDFVEEALKLSLPEDGMAPKI
jgi:hypothetical protein